MVSLRTSIVSCQPGNLSVTERWLSTLAGLALAAAGVTRGGLLRRTALAGSGLLLIARGTGGYCGVKAAAQGEERLSEALREQWERLRAQFGAGAGGIHSLHRLYTEELQELFSGEAQLYTLLQLLPRHFNNPRLQGWIHAYASEVRGRGEELGRMLGARGDDPSAHRDAAMTVLIAETRKMGQIPVEALREAAVVASLQRLVHYRIGSYASVAAYASTLGRNEEAARLDQFAERDRAIDAELTELATRQLNPRAAAEHAAQAGAAESRAPH
jgi:ferritin-like metal-binding protein YciE